MFICHLWSKKKNSRISDLSLKSTVSISGLNITLNEFYTMQRNQYLICVGLFEDTNVDVNTRNKLWYTKYTSGFIHKLTRTHKVLQSISNIYHTLTTPSPQTHTHNRPQHDVDMQGDVLLMLHHVAFILVKLFSELGISLVVWVLSYLPNPSARAVYDTRSIFKRSLTGLNSEYSF